MSSQIPITRTLKIAISIVVYLSTILRQFIFRLFGIRRSGTCVVLYYHSVPAAQRAQFAQQLDMIQRYGLPLNLQEPIALQSGCHHIAITFDDGFENYMQEALPELKKRNLPSTNFLVADAFGKRFGQEGADEPVLTIEQARAIVGPDVQFGSHTLTHPMLSLLSEEEMRIEIFESRRKLEDVLGFSVETFSFPYGAFVPRALELCAEAGYRRIYTTLPYLAFRSDNETVVGRIRVDPDDWPLEFRMKVVGAYRWLPIAFTLKRTLLEAVRSVLGRKRTTQRPTSSIHI